MSKICGIYKIKSPSNKIYIGHSTDITKRFRYYTNLNCKKQTKLYNSFIKYGVNNHIFDVILECEIKDLNYYERCFQEIYNSVSKGLNCRLSKSDDQQGHLSEETKQKLSIAHKNKVLSEEHKNILRLYALNMSEETKTKISNSLKGHILSEETKQKMSISKKGIKKPYGFAEKISKIHKGKILTDDTKAKISKATKNKPKLHKCKSIMQYDKQMNFIKEWVSITEACITLNILNTSISNNLKDRTKTCNNFIFKYK